QAKRVSIWILEPCIGSTPPGRLRRKKEVDAAFAPLFVRSLDILRHEKNPAVTADQLVFGTVRFRFDQGEVRAAVGRRHFDPANAGGKTLLSDQFETQRLHVEPLAYIQIADEHDDVLDAEVGFIAVRTKYGPTGPREGGTAGHRRDYNWASRYTEWRRRLCG